MKKMNFNLKKKCDESKKKEIFYGAMINHDIQDVYLGLCFLEPGEKNRDAGPPKGHEEILYALEGQIEVVIGEKKVIVNEGEVLFLPDGQKVKLNNFTQEKIYFVIAGGHPRPHSHHSH